MAIEPQLTIDQHLTLQTELTNKLKALIHDLIAFEELYNSFRLLKETHVIQNKASKKTEDNSNLAKYPLTAYADSLTRYRKLVKVLVPNYYFQTPLQIDKKSYQELLQILLNRPIARSSNSCVYVNAPDEREITCDDILNGKYPDRDIIDKLNALGNLTNPTGSSRDKNESTLDNLMSYLELRKFENEKSPDLDTVQFYFMLELRTSMNEVLCKFIRYITQLYKIVNTAYSQLKPLLTQGAIDNSQTKLLATNIEDLEKLVKNQLLEKFSAFKDAELKKLGQFDSLTTSAVKDEMEAFQNMVRNGLACGLTNNTLWESRFTVVYETLSSAPPGSDANMSLMVNILLNFSVQLEKFQKEEESICAHWANLFKTAAQLKPVDDPLKKSNDERDSKGAKSRSISTTSPPRAGGVLGGFFGGRKPDPSPHHARPNSAAPTDPPKPATTKKGSDIARSTSASAAGTPASAISSAPPNFPSTGK